MGMGVYVFCVFLYLNSGFALWVSGCRVPKPETFMVNGRGGDNLVRKRVHHQLYPLTLADRLFLI